MAPLKQWCHPSTQATTDKPKNRPRHQRKEPKAIAFSDSLKKDCF